MLPLPVPLLIFPFPAARLFCVPFTVWPRRPAIRKLLMSCKHSCRDIIKIVMAHALVSADLCFLACRDIGWISCATVRTEPPPFFKWMPWMEQAPHVWPSSCYFCPCQSLQDCCSERSALKSCPGERLAKAEYFCSFTTQSGPRGLKLLCSVMDNN